MTFGHLSVVYHEGGSAVQFWEAFTDSKVHLGAYRALCARCAKSWLFSTTGGSVSSED